MTGSAAVPLTEHLATLSDGTRGRILAVLDDRELTVDELRRVLQLPQSTVSRHLKTLGDRGWLQSRREGTRHLYSLRLENLDSRVRRLWDLARDEIVSSLGSVQDRSRLESVLRERRTRSREFFASQAARWDRLRDELFGADFFLRALLGLLDRQSVVGDLGCGTGAVSEALAPFVRQVIAIDGSREMLDAARERLRRFEHVELRNGELEALPLQDGELDAATLILVLHHVAHPPAVLRQIARGLRPGGRLVLCDMQEHDRSDYRSEMGHVWLGFSRDRLEEDLSTAGLRLLTYHELPPSGDARGPNLFVATMEKNDS